MDNNYKNNEEIEKELFALQASYLDTDNTKYLGMMLRPNLLPSLIRLAYFSLRQSKGVYFPIDILDEKLLDCSIKILEHIQNRKYIVTTTFYGKAYSTVSNMVRDYNRERKRYQYTFTELGYDNDEIVDMLKYQELTNEKETL